MAHNLFSGYLKIAVLVSLILIQGYSVAYARPAYPDFLNQLYGTGYSCNVCHASNSPSTRPSFEPTPTNPFGVRFQTIKGTSLTSETNVRAALKAIELDDSDGDGCRNVTELITGSALPGTSSTTNPSDCRQPFARDDPRSTAKNTFLGSINVLTNDTVSGLSGHDLLLNFASSSSTEGGSFTCGSTTCSYTPPPDFCGTDTFRYTARDIAYDVTVSSIAPPPTTDPRTTGTSTFFSSSATVRMTVGDLNAPTVFKPTPDPLVITLPAGSPGPVPKTDAGISAWLRSARASDPEDGGIPVTANEPVNFSVGNRTVTFTATDSCGNTDSVSAVVRIQVADNTNPVVIAPIPDPVIVTAPVCAVSATSSASADNFKGSILDWLSTASASDFEDGVLPVTDNAPSVFALGDTVVNFSAIDLEGSDSMVSATVRVVEAINAPPVLNAPTPDPLVVTVKDDGNVFIPVTDPSIVAWLASASATDPEDGSLTVSHNAPVTFLEGETTVEFTTTDSCGESTSLTATVSLEVSSVIITAVDRREVVSTGFVTDVPLQASAVSVVGLVLNPTVDDPGPYRPGRHTLTISATDEAGNVVTKIQTLDVKPLVVLGGVQIIGEGLGVTVPVTMNGDAPVYPVQISFSVAGEADAADHNLKSGRVTIASGRGPAEIKFATLTDELSESDESIKISVTSVSDNAALGAELQHVVLITEREIPPAVSFNIDQNGVSSNYVFSDQGMVTVTAIASDPNGSGLNGSALVFDWSQSDAVLAGAQTENQFSFDPVALVPGVYRAIVLVNDGTTQVENTVVLIVSATAPVLSPGVDSDGDGVNDSLEGRSDADGDGIQDFLDAVDDVTLLQTGNSATDNLGRLMQTESGTTLALGALALEARNNGAGISVADIHDENGDAAIDPEFVILGSAFDFEVRGLSEVKSVARIVIPLSQPAPLNAVYRKFVNGTWTTFIENAVDEVRSAKSNASICPPPGSELYVTGIIVFADCIELIITDGGPNDADGLVNGVILDPGGVAVLAAEDVPADSNATNSSPGGASSLGWWLILFTPIWWLRQRFKSLSRS